MPHIHLSNRAGFLDNAAKLGKLGHNRDIGASSGTLGNYRGNWLLSACAYNTRQQENMRLTKSMRLIKSAKTR